MASIENEFVQLIEINLLFAKAELAGTNSDPSALLRALRHINEALRDIRTHKQGQSRDAKKSIRAVA
ncbi:hypothetical protein CCR94_16090 [Rhodoblastus sphagnicola]|uniref:Uncharacterized protein n=1 Tax=Rhodoblastus sphagnicola TaxID=333368 RepID=A0A2S6N3C7_9HYPH|nr:hypothetical protein [Rhodoblastus sphagnicola]MBB4200854.1 hypothetical protein [Rhodoblastus sphagnicola]PPQ29119.1 hypothetical protein CCR94_16090 [Rhodoblastus sphagnicola]